MPQRQVFQQQRATETKTNLFTDGRSFEWLGDDLAADLAVGVPGARKERIGRIGHDKNKHDGAVGTGCSSSWPAFWCSFAAELLFSSFWAGK